MSRQDVDYLALGLMIVYQKDYEWARAHAHLLLEYFSI